MTSDEEMARKSVFHVKREDEENMLSFYLQGYFAVHDKDRSRPSRARSILNGALILEEPHETFFKERSCMVVVSGAHEKSERQLTYYELPTLSLTPGDYDSRGS